MASPSYDGSFEEVITDWIASGRTVVITTQVPEEGLDLGVYMKLVEPTICHALSGDDMTTEASRCKTMWMLGQTPPINESKKNCSTR